MDVFEEYVETVKKLRELEEKKKRLAEEILNTIEDRIVVGNSVIQKAVRQTIHLPEELFPQAFEEFPEIFDLKLNTSRARYIADVLCERFGAEVKETPYLIVKEATK